MNFFSDRKKIEQEYLDWILKNPGIKDCSLTLISFLDSSGYMRDRRSVGAPLSNRRFINALSNRKLAEIMINYSEEADFDYNYDDELEWCGNIDIYTTSDGTRFNDLESAIDHETWWLDQPCKEIGHENC